jgi:P-type Ca2+ transporter type 2C
MRRIVPAERLDVLVDEPKGLTSGQAEALRRRFGANHVVEQRHKRWLELTLDTAADPMLWFLVAASSLYALVGERGDAAVLLVAMVPLVGMDFFLHWRTTAATEGLRSRLASQARVVRDGATITIAATDVVVGDRAIVGAAESVPADGVLITADGLQMDESTLTGESLPIRKHAIAFRPGTETDWSVDGEHWVLAGTRVLTGTATLSVVFTGADTLYGEIIRSVGETRQARTALQQVISRLVLVLTGGALLVCLLLAGVRVAQGHGWSDALLSAATLASAALPEEFPVAFAFFLAIGAFRLAKVHALVRRAASVENIGRVTLICSDKTGTITEGRLELTHRLPADGVAEDRLLRLAALASRAESGDPLDSAILAASGAPQSVEVLGVFPFTEGRRRETAVVRESQATLAVVKGAFETVAKMCALSEPEQERHARDVETLAAEGHKVIACAWKTLGDASVPAAEPEDGYRFAGLLACEDPVRPGVADAIARCRELGLRPLIVTGDHPLTARAVAREIGLGGDTPRILSGDEVEEAARRGDARTFLGVDVVARALPAQKLWLVRALQGVGEIVAVTGDGVNDVPALRCADVGIAMGERGTRSARDAASIVLLDDNFRTIVSAVAEGRRLFAGLRRSFAYLLAVHLPLVGTAALIPFAGGPLLYLPVHIVWIELVVHPTALLAFLESPTAGGAPPPDALRGFFSAREWFAILASGLITAAAVVLSYSHGAGLHGDIGKARGFAVLSLVSASAAFAAVLSGLCSATSRRIAGGTLAATVLLSVWPPMTRVLHAQPLDLSEVLMAAGLGLLASVPLAVSDLGRIGRRATRADRCQQPTEVAVVDSRSRR